MKTGDLTQDEQYVLAALLGMLVKEDRTSSVLEPSERQEVARYMGPGDNAAVVEEAADRYRSCTAIEAGVQEVVRQPARGHIFGLVSQVAEAHGVTVEEMPMVSWLQEVWQL